MNSTDPTSLLSKADELRRAFDEAFAVPPPPPAPAARVFLLVRAAGDLFAIQRDRIAGISRSRNVAPTPGGDSAFLGLVEAQNSDHPVWSLSGLLGRGVQALTPTAWLVLAEVARGVRCAFVCDAVERMVFLSAAEIIPPARPGEPTLAKTDAGLVPIVEIAALHAEILKRKDSRQLRPAL